MTKILPGSPAFRVLRIFLFFVTFFIALKAGEPGYEAIERILYMKIHLGAGGCPLIESLLYYNCTTLIGLDILKLKFCVGAGEAKLLGPQRIFLFQFATVS